ncbi:hypothetical protein ACFYXH_24790 [Streptomyces sp. NPDC002730]|uniref:hypothetical protein n=1 Tax=Streptomyces sp. NPDC002730 TaxID=3364662 RepID=UPI003687AAE0
MSAATDTESGEQDQDDGDDGEQAVPGDHRHGEVPLSRLGLLPLSGRAAVRARRTGIQRASIVKPSRATGTSRPKAVQASASLSAIT